MDNIIKDISALTSIPNTLLDELVNKAQMCIAYSATPLKTEDEISVDIGIGELQIHRDGENLIYKFIPAKELDKNIRNSIAGKDDLTTACEETLVSRILSVYRNLI